MKMYLVKGHFANPDKYFSTIEEAKNYALELLEKYKSFFVLNNAKIKVTSNDKYVAFRAYYYYEDLKRWVLWGTFKRSIIEKEIQQQG